MVSNKHVFWQALLSAILIFGVGLLVGMAFEEYRNRSVENILLGSEVNILDSQLIGIASNNFNVSCEIASKRIVEFADNIFEEAINLEKYDDSSQLTGTLEILHKRYDLLRLILWNYAVETKERCGGSFHTLVYIYQYKEPNPTLSSEQAVFSRVLEDVKEQYGNEVILIPMAGDLGLTSIDLVKDEFDVVEYPVVIVDEKYLIREIEELTKISSLIQGDRIVLNSN